MTTLVTIPGMMSDARTWDAVAQAIKPKGTTVHAADTNRDATIEEMAARALAETDGNLVVVAHSMGGRVALEMGHQAPTRLRAMVLANTNTEGLGEADSGEVCLDVLEPRRGRAPFGASDTERLDAI